MQEPSGTFLEYILEAVAAVLFGISAWFSKRTIENIDSAEKIAAQNTLELANFKAEVSDKYAKISTLERVHDRIDKVGEDVKEVSNDVKDILKAMAK